MFHSRTSSAALMAIFMGAVCLLDLHAQGIGDWERLQIPARDVEIVWSGEGLLAARKATGTFMLSYDGGETWTPPESFSPWRVHISHDEKVLAVTEQGTVMFSSNNGQSFTEIESLSLHALPSTFLANNGHIILGQVNIEGVPQYYRSDDGGATWSDFAPGTTRVPQAIAANGSCYSYEEQSRIYRYNVAQNDWESVGTAPEKLKVLNVGADNRLYALTQEGKLYRSGVGEASLMPYVPDLHFMTGPGLAVSVSGEVFAMSLNSTGESILYKVSDGGDEITMIPVLPSARYFSLAVNGDGTLIASVGIGRSTSTYRYDMVGEVWKVLSIDGYGTMQKVELFHDGSVLVLTKDGLYLDDQTGQGFRFVDLPGGAAAVFRDVIPIGPGEIFGTGSEPGIDLWSTDNGISWTKIQNPATSQLFRTDNGSVYSYHGLMTQRSSDAGQTWEKVEGVGPVIHMSNSGTHLYAFGNAMSYSVDEGATWMKLPETTEHVPGILTSAVLPNGELIGGVGNLYKEDSHYYVRYQPGESSLSEYPLPCDRLNSEYLFAADANGKAYLASVCGLYRSDDGGRSWKWLAHLPSEATLTDLEITEDGDAYLGTEDGLFRLARVSSVDDRQAGISGEVTLDVRPNPLRDAGLIRFELNEAGHVRIGLYDQSGKQVRRIAEGPYSAGIHELDLGNLEGISSGSYLLVVRAGDRIAEEKVFILRDTR